MSAEKPKSVGESSVEKELLNTVLEVAGDDEKMVRDGIIKALHGVNDKARRIYLWNKLDREARGRIRRARQKVGI